MTSEGHQGHHHHNHHHHDGLTALSKALVAGIILNTAFVIIEVAAGLWVNSLALLTDAGHNLGDVASLILIIIAGILARRKPNHEYTYGYAKTTILAALVNAAMLLVAVGAIGWEAIGRLAHPSPVQGNIVSLVALAGIIINAATAFLFMKDRKKDLNSRAVFLHMASDALVAVGVLISGIIIIYTHWYWLDSVVSLLIIVIIVWGTWGLLKDSLRLSLDGVPTGIKVHEIRDYLLNLKGVSGLHDLHVWAMSTNATALTVHLVIHSGADDSFLVKLSDELHEKFNIDHTTIQVEKSTDEECEQRC
ncbi:MAG: cation diffusion facilitator family transporter [Bacteroidia bacterium]